MRLVANGQPIPSPGMSAMVTIHCEADAQRRISAPNTALLQEEGKSYVFVYDASGQIVRRREVDVVRLLADGRCLITLDEVRPGETVVSSGVHHIHDGESVTPLPPATETNAGGLL